MKPYQEHQWTVAQTEYEDFPLFLRYPQDLDYDSVLARFPRLLTVTQILSKVRDSGLPETQYNESLDPLDRHLVECFERTDSGSLVLIETYAGKRSYYFYVSDDFAVEAEKQVLTKAFPEHQLEWHIKADPAGRFIKRYSTDFDFFGDSKP